MTTTVSIYLMLKVLDLVAVHYIVTHVISALYLRALGVSKWWLAIVPLCTTFLFKSEVAYVPKWVVTFYVITSISAILAPYPCLIAYRIWVWIKDYFIAPAVCDTSPLLYMFIPFYRYVVMVKEIRAKRKEGAE